jgi:hypothetical protein
MIVVPGKGLRARRFEGTSESARAKTAETFLELFLLSARIAKRLNRDAWIVEVS